MLYGRVSEIYLLNGSLALAVFEFPVLLPDGTLLTYQARGISNTFYHQSQGWT